MLKSFSSTSCQIFLFYHSWTYCHSASHQSFWGWGFHRMLRKPVCSLTIQAKHFFPYNLSPLMLLLLPGIIQNKFTSFFKDLKMEKASSHLFPILIFFTFVLTKKAKHKYYPLCAYMGQGSAKRSMGKSSNSLVRQVRKCIFKYR